MSPPGARNPGLSTADVLERRRVAGWNELPHPDRRSNWKLLGSVLAEPMLLLLLGAATIYLLLGEASDAAILGFSVVIVVGLTLVQEWRSERALRALRELGSPRVRVCRDGNWQILPGRELVPGDWIELVEGDRVPADLDLISSNHLKVDESLLTGESVAVDKLVFAAPAEARTSADTQEPSAQAANAQAEESAQLFAGTLVVAGFGRAEVTTIGARTRMGRIGHSLGEVQSPATPLQLEMRRLVLLFGVLSLVASLLVAGLYGLLRGDWMQALLAGITLAMAIIPEEFPVVLTVFLALGAWRMARQRVLVRRAAAIEALGAITVLCTDKTGTLTENHMVLATAVPDQAGSVDEGALLRVAASACNADTRDPMDRAVLARMPQAAGHHLLKTYPLGSRPVFAQAWTSDPSGLVQFACKGAPEVVLTLCRVDPAEHARWAAEIRALAERGMRVLGVAAAERPAGQALPADMDSMDWSWRGLLGFADPLRADVPAAVAEAKRAGIRVLMLTGDHLDTATAIARQAGLGEVPRMVAGQSLENLSDAELGALLADVDGFARVRPEHKLRIVRALAARGQVTAMTGDGVNDAPALQAATVGVAMGQRGTDVAREAASIVLLDDDFSSIVRAVRMGRAIYERIVQASRFIVSVHVPIAGLALLPLLAGTPMILLPVHVVFLELIIDPACSIVFEREPVPSDIMNRAPRPAAGRLFRVDSLMSSLALGGIVLLACLVMFAWAGHSGLSAPIQGGLTFVTLVAGNIALIFRHRAGARFSDALTMPNFALWVVVVATMAGLASIALVEPVAAWFGFAALPPGALVSALLAPILPLMLVDIVLRARSRAASGLPRRLQVRP